MTQRDRDILRQFASRLRLPFPQARIWAFGSRVRGEAAEGSDLDVCVILGQVDDAVDREVQRVAWEVGFDNDLLISTVLYTEEEFERGPCARSPLVKAILREGVAA